MLWSRDLINNKIARAKAYVHYDYKKLWLGQKSFTMWCPISHRKCVNIIIFLNDICVLVLFSRISLRSVDHTIKAQERTFAKQISKLSRFLTLCVSYCFYGEVYNKCSRKCFLIAVFLFVKITLTTIGMNFAWLIRCHWLLAWLCIRGNKNDQTADTMGICQQSKRVFKTPWKWRKRLSFLSKAENKSSKIDRSQPTPIFSSLSPYFRLPTWKGCCPIIFRGT